jgi:uncharacterized membrane protein
MALLIRVIYNFYMRFYKTLLLLFIFVLPIFFVKPVLAEEIKNFDVVITAQKDGVMRVEEKIVYDFGEEERHGIYRTIPLISRVGDLYRVIKIDFTEILRDGKDEPYSVDQGAKEVEVKIGDADKTISSSHVYTIKYEVENGIGSNYEDHDEIYWNITGNDWDIPINSASAVVQTDFGVSPNRVACFTRSGNFNAQFCTFPANFNPVTTTATLQPGDGLTVVYAFPLNTFPRSTLQKDEPFADPDFIILLKNYMRRIYSSNINFLKILVPIYLVLNFLVAPYLIYWYFKKNKKPKLGKPNVNFDLPKDPNGERITPAEAGTIDNTKLDKDDITATIFDLAVRKYLKIEQVKLNKKFSPDKTDYKLVKLKSESDLNELEKMVMENLFVEKEVLVSDLKFTYTTFQAFEVLNFRSLVEKGYYTKNPQAQMNGLLTLGIILLGSLNLILGPVLIWLSRKLNGRTSLGDKMDHNIDGLKIFLKNMSRNYKWQAESGYYVEKYIPYAMSLGFIEEYMEQLKTLNPDYQPSFYKGSGNFYSTYPYFTSSMSSNITTTAPSSSSGFSGGSSGGGGGGGGGGSW